MHRKEKDASAWHSLEQCIGTTVKITTRELKDSQDIGFLVDLYVNTVLAM